MQNTKSQWTDHTVNFWWGCTKVSRACQHCYAQETASRYGKRLFGQPVEWGAGKPRFERLQAARKEALKIARTPPICTGCGYVGPERSTHCPKDCGSTTWRRPRVFVNSMSDWLDDEVPLEWLVFLLETLAMCPNVDFQLLTKRPENFKSRLELALNEICGRIPEQQPLSTDKAADWVAHWLRGYAPDNLWIGTTVEDQKAADTRIPHLLQIPAKVRFLSCEPLVGPINLAGMEYFTAKLGKYPFYLPKEHRSSVLDAGIDWVIAGGESGGESGGHAAPMHPDWVRSLRDQCAGAGVPFFFKQWGEWISIDNMQPHMDRRAYKGHHFDDGTLMLRVGTKTAGDLLDGQQHHAFPA